MPPKTREYYLATSPGRDLAWFFFGTLAAAQYRKTKAEPTPTYSVPKSRRIEVPSVEEVERKALMSPADVKAMAGAAKAKSAAARSKKSKSRTAPLRNAGPWSDWYVSEDRSYFWRARQTPNSTSNSGTAHPNAHSNIFQKPGITSTRQDTGKINLGAVHQPLLVASPSNNPLLPPRDPQPRALSGHETRPRQRVPGQQSSPPRQANRPNCPSPVPNH